MVNNTQKKNIIEFITSFLLEHGSEEMVSINQLVQTVAEVAKKTVISKHIDGPLGVRGRNSNNDLIRKELGWDFEMTLRDGIEKTYTWISERIID